MATKNVRNWTAEDFRKYNTELLNQLEEVSKQASEAEAEAEAAAAAAAEAEAAETETK